LPTTQISQRRRITNLKTKSTLVKQTWETKLANDKNQPKTRISQQKSANEGKKEKKIANDKKLANDKNQPNENQPNKNQSNVPENIERKKA
jgi:hypothetical protein